jgi:cyclopropane fatty-acyl-phospholipid synthase-like methyltransferase
MNELTSREYWSEYYSRSLPHRAQIEKICGEYDSIWKLLVNSCTAKPRNIIEIGAYPGRFLAYLASKFDLSATSLDFNPNTMVIGKSMEAMGIHDFQCINVDFLKHETRNQYDIVLSLGFVEHFQDYDKVLDRHCEYLSDHGSMLIMVPYMKYGQYLHRRIFDHENLKVHNTRCMRKSVFRNFAKRNNLNIHHLVFFGGYLTNVHKPLVGWKEFGNRLESKVFQFLNPSLQKFPNRLYSSTLIGVFSKKRKGS